MPLWRVSVKHKHILYGEQIEPGMFVEVATMNDNPVNNVKERQKVKEAFKSKYGVNLHDAFFASCDFDAERI